MVERYYGRSEGYRRYNPEMPPQSHGVEDYDAEDIQKIIDRAHDGEEISQGDVELVNEWLELYGNPQNPAADE